MCQKSDTVTRWKEVLRESETYSKKVQEGFLVALPQISRHILPESVLCLWANHLKSCLGIRPQT